MSKIKLLLKSKVDLAIELSESIFRKIYRYKLRKRLHNKGFTIISNNCCGGIIYYDLGHRFDSPTINLSINHEDYLCFLENLKEALETDIKEDCVDGVAYPVGKILLKNHQTIHLYFNHYHSFQEAVDKWNERCQRINNENLFVLMEMGRGTSKNLLQRFFSLPYEYKFALVNGEYPEFLHTKKLKFYDVFGPESNATILNYRKGFMSYKRYLHEFDFVKWLNKESLTE